MMLNETHVRLRPLALSMLLPAVGLSMACQTEPTGRFVRVNQKVERSELPPDDQTYGIDHSTFEQCPFDDWGEVLAYDPETGEPFTRSVESSTAVLRAAYDTLTDDGYTFDAALISSLSRTLDGRDSTRCGADGEPPPAPMFCDSIADASGLIDSESLERLCDPWWTECFAAMSDLDRSSRGNSDSDFSMFFYTSDARYFPLPSDEVQAQCSCSSEPEELEAAHTVMEDSYDWNLWDRVVFGDSTITIQNDAPVWGPNGAEHTHYANAGICGAWLYSDSAFKQLEQNGPDGEPSSLQQFCGGVAVLDISSNEQVKTQPLTTLWLGRTSSDRNLRVGGYGDLINAWVLAGRNDNSRACPTCDAGRSDDEIDECSVSTGAARLIFGDDLRHRADQASGPLHLLMAECAPRVDSAELGWQQACWHVELPQDDLAAGFHNTVKVGGFGPDVARDVSVLEQ